jgi:hypothetical protein
MAVQRIVGGVEIEDDLLRRGAMRHGRKARPTRASLEQAQQNG